MTRNRQGFTLVELLVVIAIIGVLIALLLPAVQQAREAARRMQCSNQMKQLGLAFHNYHDTAGRLPVANPLCDSGKRWNWTQMVLPQMEMGALFDTFDFDLAAWQGTNFQYLQQHHPAFTCPSNPLANELREEENFAAPDWIISQCDYAANQGDYANSTGIGSTPAYGNVGCDTRKSRGMMSRYGWSAAFRDAPDGLSNTFALGECIGTLSIVQNWGTQSFATTAHPINYLNQSLILTLPTNAAPRWDESIGFRSMHPGGALFLYSDASVHFLAETVDGATYRAMASRSGQEVFAMP
ncbi:DUF1559 domain-containing protein [Blastopirellula sp. J2-11]|uniref:DUF1559 domain-containing protein n=1 Tax=Blastopirellula sp. J2-11 TaxID=2943192 RepID=UPI0021C86F2C|nr:DUF1559 domain-containing protein [Blastopirellula sp. J2-11]UUO06654.1 DUF1559 domain-containing protein [Blastopirellula sp. J2-11]